MLRQKNGKSSQRLVDKLILHDLCGYRLPSVSAEGSLFSSPNREPRTALQLQGDLDWITMKVGLSPILVQLDQPLMGTFQVV